MTKLAAPAAGRVPNCQQDHVNFGGAASPMKFVGGKRHQAADHVDAVLHSIPPEAKKVRQCSAEEQQNKNKATTDHISGIMTAAPKTNLVEPSAPNASNPLTQNIKPSVRPQHRNPRSHRQAHDGLD